MKNILTSNNKAEDEIEEHEAERKKKIKETRNRFTGLCWITLKNLLNGDPNADLRDHRSALRSLDEWRRQDRGQIYYFSLTENEPRLIWKAVAWTAENPP